MNAQLKAVLLLIVNLAINGTLFAVLPAEWKVWAILAVNLIQVAIAFADPTYTIQKLGMTKSEYLGKAAEASRTK